MKRFLLLPLAAILLLVACSPAEDFDLPSSPQPSSTAGPIPATETIALPAEAATATPLPTATPTMPPTATPTPEPTEPERSTQTETIAKITSQVTPKIIQRFAAAGGTLLVEVVRYECTEIPGMEDRMAYEELRLTRGDNEPEPVAYQLQYCGGLGAYGLNGRFWTSDSRYFYFDQARMGIPDGGPCGMWIPGLQRLDSETGRVETLPGTGVSTPDDTGMVLWSAPNFIFWDLVDGETGRAATPGRGSYLFSAAFSPDGNSLLYVLRSDCFNPQAGSLVGVLDLNAGTNRALLDTEPEGFIEANWLTAETALLVDPQGKRYILTIATGEVRPQE